MLKHPGSLLPRHASKSSDAPKVVNGAETRHGETSTSMPGNFPSTVLPTYALLSLKSLLVRSTSAVSIAGSCSPGIVHPLQASMLPGAESVHFFSFQPPLLRSSSASSPNLSEGRQDDMTLLAQQGRRSSNISQSPPETHEGKSLLLVPEVHGSSVSLVVQNSTSAVK